MAARERPLDGITGITGIVDYCMGSALWVQTSPEEGIATLNISINCVQTAAEGEIVCTSRVDRRNRTCGP